MDAQNPPTTGLPGMPGGPPTGGQSGPSVSPPSGNPAPPRFGPGMKHQSADYPSTPPAGPSPNGYPPHGATGGPPPPHTAYTTTGVTVDFGRRLPDGMGTVAGENPVIAAFSRGGLAGAAVVGIGYVTAILAVIGFVVAMSMRLGGLDTNDTVPVEDLGVEPLEGFGFLVAVIVQLASMATTGSATASVEVSALGVGIGGNAHMTAMPLSVTATILVAIYISGRLLAPRFPHMGTRIVWSVLVGLGYTVIMIVMAAIFQIRSGTDPTGSEMVEGSFSAVALSPLGVALTLFLVGAVAFSTTIRPPRGGLVRSVVAAIPITAVLWVVATTVAVLGLWLYALTSDNELPGIEPFIVNGGLWVVVVAMGGTVVATTSFASETAATWALWEGTPGWAPLLTVGLVLLVVAAGVALGVARPRSGHDWWRTPVVWLLVGVAVQTLTWMSVQASLAGLLSGGANMRMGLVSLVAFPIWGALMEVSARYLAPLLPSSIAGAIGSILGPVPVRPSVPPQPLGPPPPPAHYRTSMEAPTPTQPYSLGMYPEQTAWPPPPVGGGGPYPPQA